MSQGRSETRRRNERSGRGGRLRLSTGIALLLGAGVFVVLLVVGLSLRSDSRRPRRLLVPAIPVASPTAHSAPATPAPMPKTPIAEQSSEDEMEEDELPPPVLPGLIVRWQQGDRSVTMRDRRLTLSLSPDQSPHPRLAAGPLIAEWKGKLFVRQPGEYTFSVDTNGPFDLHLGEKRVLATTETPTEATLTRQSGAAVELEAGEIPLLAHYRKDADKPAQLNVYWQRTGDIEEPIPPLSFRHAKTDETGDYSHEQTAQQGRLLTRSHRCAACHQHASEDWLATHEIAPAEAPSLSALGTRLKPTWVYHWLADPSAVRPHATMPALFDGRRPAELVAATAYLTQSDPSTWNTTTPASLPTANSATAVSLFARTGCIACHQPLGTASSTKASNDAPTLDGSGSKWTEEGLKGQITAPFSRHPESPMPAFAALATQGHKLDQLVDYLKQSRRPDWETIASDEVRRADEERTLAFAELVPDPTQQSAFASLPIPEQWQRLGREVIAQRGCLNCHHDVTGELRATTARKSSASFAEIVELLAESPQPALGCLANGTRPGIPRFGLDHEQRKAIKSFFENEGDTPATPSPAFHTEILLERFRCLSCHERAGMGGTFTTRIAPYMPAETDHTPRDVSPPALTAIGEKSLPSWLNAVVAEGERCRPWMDLVMPHFTNSLSASSSPSSGSTSPAFAKASQRRERELDELIRGLSRADGIDPDNPAALSGDVSPSSPVELEQARTMVGRTVFNCVSCHDLKGVPGSGVRAPDLAKVSRRVRPEWFVRWLRDPQRIQPGTRMPSVFFGGRSMAPHILDGDVDRQLAALWDYLAQGDQLDPPERQSLAEIFVPGGENPIPKIDNHPLLMRGFMPGVAGLRGMAMGFPAGVHFAYDTETCSLTRIWKGRFVELGGWTDDGRGSAEDNGIRPLESPLAELVDQPAWSLDFTASRLHPEFLGTWFNSTTVGVDYRLTRKDQQPLLVHEELSPSPKTMEMGVAFERRLQIASPSGPLTKQPLLFRAFDAAKSSSDSATDGLASVKVGGRVALVDSGPGNWEVEIKSAPAGTRWRVADAGHAGPLLEIPSEQISAKPLTIALVYRLLGGTPRPRAPADKGELP